jgi:cobaltochelatase CobS
MNHNKHFEVKTLVEAGVSVLLTGERGSGKTTLVKGVAESLNLSFFSMSMTRQTTLSHLLGFMNVNGVYIPSQLRTAAETGGVYLLDEIDASDPNVLLCLNTVENGYIAFPDKVVSINADFRLMATSNPQDNHRDYNGRAKLDASTMDRFDIISVEKDDLLEQSIVDYDTFSHMELIRKCLSEVNSSTYISMRDSIRFQKRKELKLLGSFVDRLLQKDLLALEKYSERKLSIPKFQSVEDCQYLQDVWDHTMNSNSSTKTEDAHNPKKDPYEYDTSTPF